MPIAYEQCNGEDTNKNEVGWKTERRRYDEAISWSNISTHRSKEVTSNRREIGGMANRGPS